MELTVNHIKIFSIVAVLILCSTGCLYTVLRDLDEEARIAEFAAIDSLSSAPDLTISRIEYKYIPPPPRGPLDRPGGFSPQIIFYLTVSNIGNADFAKPYLIVFRNPSPHEYQVHTFYEMLQNKKWRKIPPDSCEEVRFPTFYMGDSASYIFTIVTNSIIQQELIEALERRVHYPPIPPLSREFRYDNNEASITLPTLKEILRDAQRLK